MENGASITSGNNFICIPNGSKVDEKASERKSERVADTCFTTDQQRANEYNIALNSRTRTINIVEQFTVGAHVKTVLRVASNMAKAPPSEFRCERTAGFKSKARNRARVTTDTLAHFPLSYPTPPE
uniref:Uncharacterized protein n=1 Tax=Vespula pensylvanica TaxID=30213 RepID=A0A834KCE0_VESPE|nr:hypothetical protein H0235_014801 [Vespula pensylvanica]